MPEIGAANIEISHKLNEGNEHQPPHSSKWLEALEILEALVLATVAIATAWSGYQAAKWDGLQDELYEHSTRLRVEAQGLAARGGQEEVYDASIVTEWLKAESLGQNNIATLFARRFRPEARVAFDAWVKTDPIHNPDAPPGPLVMPEYHNAHLEQAAQVGKEASAAFEKGSQARSTSDGYVRVTVGLATVLLLVAISQRFKTRQVRVGLAVIALLLVCIPIYRIAMLPRL
jgi:hypothetical protein